MACPYCHGKTLPYVHTQDFNRKVSTIVYRLDECSDCGLIFVSNPPSNLAPYYHDDYHVVPDSLVELEPILETQKFKIDLLTDYVEAGDLLEIGPGIGMFALLAKRRGFNVTTIEIDERCNAFLQSQIGVRSILSGDPSDVLTGDGALYDAICLWHAIEHLPEPWRVLDAAINRLRRGGILLIAAPNPTAWQAKLLGKRWPHHDVPRHLFALPLKWLKKFCQERSMTIELETTRDEGGLYWNRFTWAMLLRNLAKKPKLQRNLWRLGEGLGHLLNIIEGAEGKGATYTMIFRK